MEQVFREMYRSGVVPVVTLPDPERAVKLARALLRGGIGVLEIAMRNSEAADCIRAVRTRCPEIVVGAGTVLTPAQAEEAYRAGAMFGVAPGYDEEIIDWFRARGIPFIPGIISSTDVQKGVRVGLSVLKFFPSEPHGGLRTIRYLAAPFKMVKFLPAGGVGFDNLEEYLSDPAVLACAGGFMARASHIENEEWDTVTSLCRRIREIVERVRPSAGQMAASDPEVSCSAAKTRGSEVPCPAAEVRGSEAVCPAGDIHSPAVRHRVVGFGDYLLRLSPPGYLRVRQARSFELNYTGAEANVLVSLACMDVGTDFVTRLPANMVADSGIDELRRFGVGTSHIVRGGERIGIFYAEKGASQRPSRIVYDRKYSGIAEAGPGMFDWDAIFVGASHFHITGITPALGKRMPAASIEAVRKAKEHGLTVSCDLNYRSNMWSPEEARSCMDEMLKNVDILIANEEDAEKVLGIRAKNSDVTAGKLDREGYVDVAGQICGRYPVKEVGITLRRSISASDNEWGAMLYSGGQAYFSRTYPVHIVDRVGGGDSFAAGLIYGHLKGFDPQKTVKYAAAASCLKHSIEMDFNLSSVAEIELLMNGDASGRVQR